MADSVRCPTCRGYKKVNGIGGIERDCHKCSGKGTVAPEAVVVTQMAAAATDEIVEAIKKKEPEVSPAKNAQLPVGDAIFPGYSNELMSALLDEPKLPLQEWKKKHMRNTELFVVAKDMRGQDQIVNELLDLHMRNSIRLLYAQSKPVAPRKVNAMAAQDMAARSDADYVRYEKQQKAKADLEARNAN
jgi:hypothetical protein